MIQAPVGHHCPHCVHEGNKGVRPVRWSPAGPRGWSQITPVVKSLIMLNVAVFLVSEARPSLVLRYAQIPRLIAGGQYERLLTSAFLHAGVTHILFNMLALLIMGPPVEAAIGAPRFASLYLLAALGGSVCSYLFSNPSIESVGASGAIFGVFGAYFVLARSRRADTGGILVLIGVNLAFSFYYGRLIDWRAHVGGLVVGTMVAAGFAFAETRPPGHRRSIEIGVVVAVLALLLALVRLRTGQLQSLA